MTAEVKFDEGQKQLLSEFDWHCGINESQVLRQDGRRDGQGALDRGEPAGGAEVADMVEAGDESGLERGGA
jgi:hypothetical protein